MENEASTLIQVAFKQEVFCCLGLIYFALLIYWLASIWQTISPSLSERIWALSGAIGGLGYGIIAALEWGWAAIGTAFSVGFCITLALMNASVAASFLASLLFLRPWELVENDPYLGLLPRLSFILCLGHVLIHFAKVRKIEVTLNLMSISLIAFTFWCFITTFFAPDPGASLGEFFDGFIKSIFLYFILIHVVRTPESLRMLIVTLLLSFLFVGSMCVFQTFHQSSLLVEPDLRLTGFGAFTNSNDIAALMVLILPFAVVTTLRKSEALLLRVTGAALSFIAFVAVILSRSRGAMLGIAAVIAVYIILRIGKKALIPVVAGLLLLAIPATILVSNRSQEDLEGSTAGRKTYLKAGILMGLKNPVFGVGFDAFPVSLENYSTESLEESKQMTAHNSWVLVFAEMGFIGFLIFTCAFFTCLFSAWKIYQKSPEFLLSVVGYGVTMFFLSHSYLIYPYLLYALVEIASFRNAETA